MISLQLVFWVDFLTFALKKKKKEVADQIKVTIAYIMLYGAKCIKSDLSIVNSAPALHYGYTDSRTMLCW